MPAVAVQRRMLERLHQRGFADLQELETSWAMELEPERFAQPKCLLLDLNQLTTGS